MLAAALLVAGAPAVFGANIGVAFYDQRFGLLNDATGAYSQVSNLPIAGGAAGLAALNGLYYLEDLGDNLFTADPLTGTASKVGSAGMNLDVAAFAGTATALFEMDRSSNLYSIDAATGAAKKIGATGIAPANRNHDTSLSSDGTWLYYTVGLEDEADELYRINVLTGIAADLGNTGVRSVAGSAFVNGQLELFQYGEDRNYIYTAADGSTRFTRGAQLSSSAQIIDGGALLLPTADNTNVTGLVPEPNTFVLAGLGLVAACLVSALREHLSKALVPVVARRGG